MAEVTLILPLSALICMLPRETMMGNSCGHVGGGGEGGPGSLRCKYVLWQQIFLPKIPPTRGGSTHQLPIAAGKSSRLTPYSSSCSQDRRLKVSLMPSLGKEKVLALMYLERVGRKFVLYFIFSKKTESSNRFPYSVYEDRKFLALFSLRRYIINSLIEIYVEF